MVDPTCTENGYCLTCGATGKPAKGHDWVDTGLDVITATSIYSVYKCTNCSATKEEYEGEQEPEESSTTTTTTTSTTTESNPGNSGGNTDTDNNTGDTGTTTPDTGEDNNTESGGSTSKPTTCKHLWETITSPEGTSYRTCTLCGLSYIIS